MKKGKRLLAVSLAVVMAVSSFAGNGYVAQAKGIDTNDVTALGKSKKAVTSVSITNVDDPVLVLKKKGTYKLKVKVKATGGASKKVTYTSSKPKIVSVTSKGKLKAKKNGTAKITVKSKFNKKKKAVLTVKVGTPVKKVELKETKLAIKVGETAILAVTVSPKKPTRKQLSYISSDEKIATVDKNGVVTAVAAGEAKITVKATDGSKKKAVATVTVTEEAATPGQPTTPEQPTTPQQPGGDTTEEPKEEEPKYESPYTEADVVWSDEFEGDSLNREDWNVELHEPGWVNSELQEYVDSDDNIYVKDGNLVIKAIKTEDGYTSGRVNTKDKHDFKYGKFEARVKVPEGMGFLPAFWMMPTDENLYGQWPKCGEIDIMEVMGQTNDLVYGTIHYGEPHRESQGKYTLSEGNFTDDYHVFSCEWEPGKIKWIVDGVLYHEESDWYSAKSGQGTVSYPAPFDQPFYMILNLAVGGSWVGNPDETTSFDNAELVVDYVKVYQKDESEYDENVKKPEKDVVLRDPDANGNYVNNGDFAVAESLTDDKDWVFMTALGGEAGAAIEDGTMKIVTTNEGTVDYSVQLVQAGIPFEKGATYQLSFDAKASAARTMKVDVKAPDYGYASYMPTNVVDLTTEMRNYTLDEFKMTSDSDANGRLEFNMGAAGSTADITISNVVIKKTKEADPDEKEEKTILADGNHVYNGSFQEGEGRLGYWEITNNAEASVSVTNLADGRRLKVTVDKDGAKAEDVQVAQSDLALAGGKKYALSFDAQADAEKTMKVEVAGETYTAELTTDKKSYTFKFTTKDELTNKNIVFYMGEKGTIYLDNVRLVEDTLIKNGSFDAGFAGYDPYVDSSADASYVVDSQSEDNAADFTIRNTGDADWKIQLKQSNVLLEEGKWYTLKFDAKSSLERKIQYSIQRDGSVHKDAAGGEDWTPYVQDIVSLTSEYQTIEKTFQMKEGTDEGSIFNIAMGAVGGTQITTQHRICIDNISLEEVEAPEIPEVPAGDNLVKNGDFSETSEEGKKADSWDLYVAEGDASADVTYAENKAKIDITNVGENAWDIQLIQSGLSLEEGYAYTVKFKAKSSDERQIQCVLQNVEGSSQYGADWGIGLSAEEKDVTINFTMKNDTDTNAVFAINMGKMTDGDTPTSTITISDVSIVEQKVEEEEIVAKPLNENLLLNPSFTDGNKDPWWSNGVEQEDIQGNAITLTINGVGEAAYGVQFGQSNIQLEKGCTYQITFKVKSDQARDIICKMGGAADPWPTYGSKQISLSANSDFQTVDFSFIMETTDKVATFEIDLGKINDGDETLGEHTITISELSLMKIKEAE